MFVYIVLIKTHGHTTSYSSAINRLNIIHTEPTSKITPILVLKIAPCYIGKYMHISKVIG